MVSAQSVCNELIKRSMAEKVPVTPIKLQKLLYLIYGYGLYKFNEPLFKATFEAWKYGPVCDEVYFQFKNFKNNAITSYAKDAMGLIYMPNKNSYLNDKLFKTIDFIWNRYKNICSSDLIELTHKENSAWRKAGSNGIISNDDIIEDFKKGLYEI